MTNQTKLALTANLLNNLVFDILYTEHDHAESPIEESELEGLVGNLLENNCDFPEDFAKQHPEVLESMLPDHSLHEIMLSFLEDRSPYFLPPFERTDEFQEGDVVTPWEDADFNSVAFSENGKYSVLSVEDGHLTVIDDTGNENVIPKADVMLRIPARFATLNLKEFYERLTEEFEQNIIQARERYLTEKARFWEERHQKMVPGLVNSLEYALSEEAHIDLIKAGPRVRRDQFEDFIHTVKNKLEDSARRKYREIQEIAENEPEKFDCYHLDLSKEVVKGLNRHFGSIGLVLADSEEGYLAFRKALEDKVKEGLGNTGLKFRNGDRISKKEDGAEGTVVDRQRNIWGKVKYVIRLDEGELIETHNPSGLNLTEKGYQSQVVGSSANLSDAVEKIISDAEEEAKASAIESSSKAYRSRWHAIFGHGPEDKILTDSEIDGLDLGGLVDRKLSKIRGELEIQARTDAAIVAGVPGEFISYSKDPTEYAKTKANETISHLISEFWGDVSEACTEHIISQLVEMKIIEKEEGSSDYNFSIDNLREIARKIDQTLQGNVEEEFRRHGIDHDVMESNRVYIYRPDLAYDDLQDGEIALDPYAIGQRFISDIINVASEYARNSRQRNLVSLAEDIVILGEMPRPESLKKGLTKPSKRFFMGGIESIGMHRGEVSTAHKRLFNLFDRSKIRDAVVEGEDFSDKIPEHLLDIAEDPEAASYLFYRDVVVGELVKVLEVCHEDGAPYEAFKTMWRRYHPEEYDLMAVNRKLESENEDEFELREAYKFELKRDAEALRKAVDASGACLHDCDIDLATHDRAVFNLFWAPGNNYEGYVRLLALRNERKNIPVLYLDTLEVNNKEFNYVEDIVRAMGLASIQLAFDGNFAQLLGEDARVCHGLRQGFGNKQSRASFYKLGIRDYSVNRNGEARTVMPYTFGEGDGDMSEKLRADSYVLMENWGFKR